MFCFRSYAGQGLKSGGSVKKMVKSILFFVIFIAMVILYLRHLEFNSLYYPSKQVLQTPGSLGLDYQDVVFETRDHKKINAWFISAGKTAPVIYFLHGNGGNVGDRLSKIVFFHDLRSSVFIIDYRGYGKSTGIPSEQGLYCDALAGYGYLRNDMKIAPSQIIVYGESLGGAVAVELASKASVGGIILEGVFTSVADMAKKIYPVIPAFFINSKYDSYSKIKNIEVPKLFIHSRQDEIVPFVFGEKLFKKAVGPKEFFQAQGGHNDCFFIQPDKIKYSVASFLKRCGFNNSLQS